MAGDARRQPRKINCFQCGCLVLLCAWGLMVALPVNRSLGWVAGVVGFALAIAGALGGWYAIERWYAAGPFLPACHTGKCQGTREAWGLGDYQLVQVGDYVVHRCRCGHEYMMRRGRRFMERVPDGTLKPYMVHRPFRGWFPDRGPDA
jgi:hypothetical protein